MEWFPTLNDEAETEQEAPVAALHVPSVHWPSGVAPAETLAVPVTATVVPPMTFTVKATGAFTVEGFSDELTVVVGVAEAMDNDRLPLVER